MGQHPRIVGQHDQNIQIRAFDGPNALAVNDNGERIIFYNPDFLKSIDLKSNTNWASVSVIAHEVGHHLNNHLLGSSDRIHFELEADEFSGFVMHKLGASLEEAQIAAFNFLPHEGSATHPPKSVRLKAIERGWIKDAPKFEMSEDFENFIGSLPQTIYAKPRNKTTDRYILGYYGQSLPPFQRKVYHPERVYCC